MKSPSMQKIYAILLTFRTGNNANSIKTKTMKIQKMSIKFGLPMRIIRTCKKS